MQEWEGVARRSSLLAQRAASEGPRWTRAVEEHLPTPRPILANTVKEVEGREKERSGRTVLTAR